MKSISPGQSVAPLAVGIESAPGPVPDPYDINANVFSTHDLAPMIGKVFKISLDNGRRR